MMSYCFYCSYLCHTARDIQLRRDSPSSDFLMHFSEASGCSTADEHKTQIPKNSCTQHYAQL